MENLVIVESSCVGTTYTGRAAESLGYQPIFLTDPTIDQGETQERMKEFEVIHCDTSSVSSMVSALSKADISNVTATISLCDTNIMASIDLADVFGAKSIDKTARSLKDKGNVYRLVPEYSPPSIAFDSHSIPFDKLKQFFAEYGRIIFKANCSSGGHGSFLLDDYDEDVIKQSIAGSGIPSHLKPDQWMAQVAIDGELISLEGYSHHGTIQFIGFSGRKKVGMTESIVIFPYAEQISRHVQAQAKEAVSILLSRAGFMNGYFHVEFLITNKNAYLIDANIGRIGGGGMSEQFASTFGANPDDIYRHILALSLDSTDLDGQRLYNQANFKTWSAMYGVPEKATVNKVIVPDDFPCFHTRIISYGTTVPPMGVDNYSWIGIVSGRKEDVDHYASQIVIETSEGIFKAVF